MKENILIINICKEKLHYYEFVKPIEDILKNFKKENLKNMKKENKKINYFVKHYKFINNNDLKKSDKVIICGTSLYDNEFIKDIKKFKWLLDFEKPVLGVCGGMEIIGLIFNGKLKRKTEIGFCNENFDKNFLGLTENCEVYHLHNYYIDFSKVKDFVFFCFSNGIIQAVKHKNKDIYGVLFHPEVRHKNLIKNFVLQK